MFRGGLGDSMLSAQQASSQPWTVMLPLSSSSWLHLLMHPSGRSYAVFFLNLTLSFSIFFPHNSGLARAASWMCRGLGCHGSIGGFFISRWARHNPHCICYVNVFLCTDSTSVFISCIFHVFLFIPFKISAWGWRVGGENFRSANSQALT